MLIYIYIILKRRKGNETYLDPLENIDLRVLGVVLLVVLLLLLLLLLFVVLLLLLLLLLLPSPPLETKSLDVPLRLKGGRLKEGRLDKVITSSSKSSSGQYSPVCKINIRYKKEKRTLDPKETLSTYGDIIEGYLNFTQYL